MFLCTVCHVESRRKAEIFLVTQPVLRTEAIELWVIQPLLRTGAIEMEEKLVDVISCNICGQRIVFP
jgi:hypothetical protein